MIRRKKFVPDPNWNPPKETTQDSYSVAVIEGTGTKAGYVKLSDKLIRSSRIFWHLCEKIHEAKRVAGVWRMWATKYKDRVKEIKVAFRQFEKEADVILKEEVKKNEILLRRIERYKQTLKRKDYIWRWEKKERLKAVRISKKLRDEVRPIKNNINFLTRELRWGKSTEESEEGRIELMLRGIYGFKKLEHDKEISFEDFIYLSIGHQLDAFNKTHVRNRFGAELTRFFTRDIKVLIEKGYVKRFDRRELYYVTEDGKKFYSEKMRKIFARKTFLYWKGITEKIK